MLRNALESVSRSVLGGGRDVDVACTMDARARDGAIRNQVGMLAMSPIGLDEEQNATVDYFGTLKARMEGGGFEGAVCIPILEPGARTGVSTDDVRCSDGIGQPGDPMFTLQRGKQHGVAFAQNTRDEIRMFNGDGQIVGALGAEPGTKQQCYIATTETSHCLNAGGMGRIDYETETLVAHTLKKRYDSSEDGTGRGIPLVAMAHGIDGVSGTLRSNPGSGFRSNGSNVEAVVSHGSFGVRRLTPRECERLQGFSDDYTALDKAADGPRYKALGNSMAVPCIAFIGRRILAALERKNGNGSRS